MSFVRRVTAFMAEETGSGRCKSLMNAKGPSSFLVSTPIEESLKLLGSPLEQYVMFLFPSWLVYSPSQ